MKFSNTVKQLGLGFALTALCAASHANNLEQIKSEGTLRVAIAMGVPMFSYANAEMQPEGSDVATAKLLAKDLGVKLQLVQITNAARVPTIQTHQAAITVENLSITTQRAKIIAFSIPYSSLPTICDTTKT